jgi:hypothetical protein
VTAPPEFFILNYQFYRNLFRTEFFAQSREIRSFILQIWTTCSVDFLSRKLRTVEISAINSRKSIREQSLVRYRFWICRKFVLFVRSRIEQYKTNRDGTRYWRPNVRPNSLAWVVDIYTDWICTHFIEYIQKSIPEESVYRRKYKNSKITAMFICHFLLCNDWQ